MFKGIKHWLLGVGSYMSHGHCYMWNPYLVGLHVVTDTAIGLSYVAIALTLWQFVRKARATIPFQRIFIAFGAFIIACGGTHLMEVWSIWTPVYWLSGIVKLITATASIATAIALPAIVPRALAMLTLADESSRRKADLEKANLTLLQELAERARAEAEVRTLNRELEVLVHERSRQLAQADSILNAKVEELRLTEQRIDQMTESKFHLVANSIPQLAWIADEHGWIYWFNERWFEYTGTAMGQVEGWGWQTVIEPSYLPAVLDRWNTVIETGQPSEMEFPIRGASGEYRMFCTRVEAVRNSAGRIVRWVGTNTDVEDRRQAESHAGDRRKAGMNGFS